MTEPTDDELDAVIAEYRTRIYPQDMHPRFERAIMRAAIAKWGTPPPKWEPVAWNDLTDEDRERAMNSMPGMLEGFTKTWGWLHFAKAIEAICREKNAQPAPAAQGDALDAARYRYLRDGDWREHEKLESVIRLQLNTLWDAKIDAARAALAPHGQAPAQAAPAAVAGPSEFPHEQMDGMALARYKVVPSHESMFHRHAVVAGDGSQQLYIGREVECQNMARKFAGAFLDGAFAFHSMLAAAPTQPSPQADSQPAPQGETNAHLDTDSNSSAPGQQRDVAGTVALGQSVGHGSDSTAGDPSAQGDKLLTVAERNIRSFLRSATFKSESDREAALNCVDVLWAAARAPADSVTAPSQQVIVDFAQVGTAGPFAVVDGRVSLPDATMQDLVHMLRPAFNAQAADSVLEDAACAGFFLRLPQRPKPEAPAGTVGLDWDAYSGAQMLAYGRDCSNAAIVATQKQGGL